MAKKLIATEGSQIEGKIKEHGPHEEPFHDVTGVFTSVSTNVFIKGKGVARQEDTGTTTDIDDGLGFTANYQTVPYTTKVKVNGKSVIRIEDQVDVHGQNLSPGSVTVVNVSPNTNVYSGD